MYPKKLFIWMKMLIHNEAAVATASAIPGRTGAWRQIMQIAPLV